MPILPQLFTMNFMHDCRWNGSSLDYLIHRKEFENRSHSNSTVGNCAQSKHSGGGGMKLLVKLEEESSA